jgi:hypothetical protein
MNSTEMLLMRHRLSEDSVGYVGCGLQAYIPYPTANSVETPGNLQSLGLVLQCLPELLCYRLQRALHLIDTGRALTRGSQGNFACTWQSCNLKQVFILDE